MPFKVRPLVTFIFGAKTLPMSRVPSSVTPLRVLPPVDGCQDIAAAGGDRAADDGPAGHVPPAGAAVQRQGAAGIVQGARHIHRAAGAAERARWGRREDAQAGGRERAAQVERGTGLHVHLAGVGPGTGGDERGSVIDLQRALIDPARADQGQVLVRSAAGRPSGQVGADGPLIDEGAGDLAALAVQGQARAEGQRRPLEMSRAVVSEPPKRILPVPDHACVPCAVSVADVLPLAPPSRIVPFKVRPLVTFIFGAKTLPMSRVPSSVTPLKVLLLLTAVRTLAPLVVIVPPMMVPPNTFHPPVRLSSARVLPVLSRVPVTFTVPPVRLNEPAGAGAKMPRPAVVNEPPRLSVAPACTFILPVLDQLPACLERGSVIDLQRPLIDPTGADEGQVLVRSAAGRSGRPGRR